MPRGRPTRDRAREDRNADEALAVYLAGPRDGLFRQRELTAEEQEELVIRLGSTAHAVDEVSDLAPSDE